jgi:NAD(P)-dependent dehydrogenase (short-subunit alcohol dehydrogenase family)
MASKKASERLNQVAKHVRTESKSDLFQMTDKVVLVTGGSRGLGLEMVKAFGEMNASAVIIASRKGEECHKVASVLSESYPKTKFVGKTLHVGKWEDCNRVIAEIVEEFGILSVLVNNAGMSPLYSSLHQITEELYDKVLDVNLKGPFRLSVLAAEQMCQNGGGSILNISSVASTRPTASEIPYGMAKAGLNNLTLGLSRTFGPLVRVNCIIAGPFLTDISNAWDMNWFQEYARKSLPLARAGDPREIVGAALYFCSDASSYTTGALLEIHGGPNKF